MLRERIDNLSYHGKEIFFQMSMEAFEEFAILILSCHHWESFRHTPSGPH